MFANQNPLLLRMCRNAAEQQTATGISESLVRISVGLEDEQNLIADFAQALKSLNDKNNGDD